MKNAFLEDLLAQKKRVLSIFLFTSIITAISIVLPYITKVLIDQEIPDRNLKQVILLMVLSVTLIIINVFIKKNKIKMVADTSISFQLECRNRIFLQIQQIPYHYLNKVRFGYYNTNLIQDVENLSNFLFNKIAGTVSDIIFFISSFLVLMWVSPLMTGVLYFFIIIFTLFIYYLKRIMSHFYDSMAKSREELNDIVHEMLSARKIIALNHIEEHCMSEVRKRDHILLIHTLKANIFGPLIQSSVEIATMITYILTFVLYEKCGMTLGEVFLFLTYLPQVWGKFSTMMDILNNLVASKVLIQRIYKENNENLFQCFDNSEETEIRTNFPSIRTVELKNADFSFEGNRQTLFSNFHIKIDMPGVYCVMGPSGIGKSTLFDLLLGFYRLDKGAILYNGQELNQANAISARRQVGLVPQEDYLFQDSVWMNITMGRKIERSKVESQIGELGLEEYFCSLPNGLDTEISDSETLSSGQKKAVAILRACCTRPSILLFDEVTSNLDGKSSRDIDNAVEVLSAESICMYITHKISFPGKGKEQIIIS